MEAVKFIKELSRMCKSNKTCESCVLSVNGYSCLTNAMSESPEAIADIISKWSKEHPIITNRQKFKEIFGCGYRSLPCPLPYDGNCPFKDCNECLKWWDKEYIEPKEK